MKVKYEFIRSYISSYDCGLTAPNLNISFGICSSSNLFGDIYSYCSQAKIRVDNFVLAKVVMNQLSYNCCITFSDKLTAKEYNKLKTDKTKRIKVPNEPNLFYLHICDSVPVMIGSALDRFIALNFRPKTELLIPTAELRSLMKGRSLTLYA